MSEAFRAAHAFIQRISSDAALRETVEKMDLYAKLSDVIALAEGYGYLFDEAAFKKAYRANWIMRWHLYNR